MKSFIFLILFFFIFSSISARSKSKNEANHTILILAEEQLKVNQDYQFDQKIIEYLNHKQNKYKLQIHLFKDVSEVTSSFKNTDSFSKVYIFLNRLNIFKILNYHKKILALENILKKQSGSLKFYFYETNSLVKLTYHPLLESMFKIRLLFNTQNILKDLEPNIKLYTYKFEHNKSNQTITIRTKKRNTKMANQCIPYWSSDTIQLIQYQLKSDKFKKKKTYKIANPRIKNLISHDSIFYCFFKNKNFGFTAAYKITYPKIEISLSPEEILAFYKKKEIVEKEITIDSNVEIRNLRLLIKVDQLKGKPPTLFSDNQKWNWDASSKFFSLAKVRSQTKLHSIDSGQQYKIDLAIIGRKNDFLSGDLLLKNNELTLAKFPITFKPYYFGANLFSILLIHPIKSLSILFLFLVVAIFLIRKKRYDIKHNVKLGEAIGEFVFMIKKQAQQFFLSKDDNPFNCHIPYIDNKYIVAVNGAKINIKKDKDKNGQSFDLNESLGKFTYNLGETAEIVFSQEKFYEKKNRSIIIMKIREKPPS